MAVTSNSIEQDKTESQTLFKVSYSLHLEMERLRYKSGEVIFQVSFLKLK